MAKLAIVICLIFMATQDTRGKSTGDGKDWKSSVLARENKYRARHGVADLVLVKELNEAAQHWAEELATKCEMVHSDKTLPIRQYNNDTTGENLYTFGGADDPKYHANYASKLWYAEIKNYPYPEYTGQPLPGMIGHFTQTIWKDTKYVGYGYKFNKKCPEDQAYVVARYFPAGNYEGEYKENVLPLKN